MESLFLTEIITVGKYSHLCVSPIISVITKLGTNVGRLSKEIKTGLKIKPKPENSVQHFGNDIGHIGCWHD